MDGDGRRGALRLERVELECGLLLLLVVLRDGRSADDRDGGRRRRGGDLLLVLRDKRITKTRRVRIENNSLLSAAKKSPNLNEIRIRGIFPALMRV